MLIRGTIVDSAAAVVGGMMAVGASVGSFAGIYANSGIWDALINGRWDAIGELLDGIPAVKTTATTLPYLAA